MAEVKTKVNNASVLDFINKVEDKQKLADSKFILELMEKATGKKAKMWGTSIIGCGTYKYKYATGRTGEWMEVGFSPRKQNLTLYIMSGFTKFDELLTKLGKHKTGKSCLYIKRLSDINIEVLTEIINASIAKVRNKEIDYGEC